MKLVLASQNKKKIKEMDEILSQLGIQVCSQAEAGVDVDVEETGTTFEENSLLKAKSEPLHSCAAACLLCFYGLFERIVSCRREISIGSVLRKND